VASRLSKSFHRPAFVIGFDDEGIGKGSGRSIEGFSLVHALVECGGALEKFGGHEMAAGLTVRRERFGEFQRMFLDCASARLTQADLEPRLRIDGEVSFDEINMAFLGQHDLMQPFGAGNPQPLLVARGVRPTAEPRVLKEKHLLFELKQDLGKTRAIFFNGAGTDLPRPPWDVAFRVERNEFRDTVSVQVQITALRSSQP
jgi:single-stranded-DNA-specific exonuclease